MSSCNTRLKMTRDWIASLLLQILITLACFANSNGLESDISCLRSIKETLEDPLRIFSTWNFNNNSEVFICGFTGVECWSPDENRVLNIQLRNMELRGPFPMGIRNCTSVSGLDLSGNYLSGSIPFNLPVFLPYITMLDLSNNNLSGPIPSSIANMTFINVLRLDDNHLTGQIPQELFQLKRLKVFSVANNRLSGPLPIFPYTTFPEESYAHNLGLCGGPLKSCSSENINGVFFSGFAVGCSLFTILSMWFMLFCSPKLSISNMLSYLLHPIKKIKGRKHHLMPRSPQILVSEEISSDERKVNSSVSLSILSDSVFDLQVTPMESFVRRLSLPEIKRATDDFDNKNVIGYGNMGVMYKGVLINNLLFAIKRIHKFESFEKEFLTIIEILGRLQHTNLVSLIGFCFERKKKFLVYKYISNGSLHHWLHCRPQVDANKTEWTLRFKIAEGVAQGLAWLHHNNVLQVAHLKVSSKCVLLDDNFEPKISNFGNAMILMNARRSPSSGSNFVVPDSSPYKEDVYSFGILLLELITGREPATWINTPTEHLCKEFNVIDECLMGQGFNEEIYETLRIAAKCIQAHRDGETSMLQVYREIRAIGKSRNKIYVNSCMDVEDHE